jgi:hypothetical protein
VIKGGGTDLTRRNGQVKKGDTIPDKKTYDLKAAKAALEKAEGERLKSLKAKIEATIEANPAAEEIQEPAAARHHQRRLAHPDRRRAEPPDVRAGQAPRCSPTRATSCTCSASC